MHSPAGPRERALALIHDLTSNADTVQQTTLSQILAQNSNSEYLRQLLPDRGGGNNSRRAVEPHIFKRVAPLTCYEDIQPYIQRIADGDESSLLTDRPVTELITSSGTSSGMQKLFPAIEADSERRKLLCVAFSSIIHRKLQGLDNGKDALFQFVHPRKRTDGGLLAQFLLTSHLHGPEAKQDIQARNVSPIEVVLCEDVKQSTYCQLLCALLLRQEVSRVGTFFANGLLQVIDVLKSKWKELVKDIRTGSLNEREVFDPRVRKAVERQIKGPNPALAMQVEEECCRQPMWEDIICRLWPRAECVQCAVSGSMEQYIPMVNSFSGGLPIISPVYAASECMFGINMNPLCSPYEVSYTFLPNMAYFEFLPLDATSENDNDGERDEIFVHQSQLVDLVNVKLGQKYEVVVTTFAGLYRLRVGDCVQVTGFHNKAPQFRLVGRKNVVLSIGLDKTDETTLQKAVCTAKVKHLEATSSCRLVDYTSYTDISTMPGHYVLFWEVAGCKVQAEGTSEELRLDTSVMEACCDTIEECLDAVYTMGKASWIGPLEIRVVREGSFQALMEYANVVKGVSVGQYKTPRAVKLAPLLELLNSRVSHRFFASHNINF